MNVIKEGGHRLFEEDQETTRYVREMLDDLRKNGMDAVRKYSQKFDDWNPELQTDLTRICQMLFILPRHFQAPKQLINGTALLVK